MSELCQLAADWRGDVPAGGTWWEEKRDGWRALRFAGRDGSVRLWSRNGHPIEGAGHILHRLAMMERIAGQPMMFDGEFQVGGTLQATKDWCERGWKRGGEAGTLYLFDAMPLSAWRAGGDARPLYQRKAALAELVRASEAEMALSWEWREGARGPDDPTAVQILADGWAADAGEVLDEAKRIWAAGGEGLMLKDAEAPYRRNRNDAWRKVKPDGPWWRTYR